MKRFAWWQQLAPNTNIYLWPLELCFSAVELHNHQQSSLPNLLHIVHLVQRMSLLVL